MYTRITKETDGAVPLPKKKYKEENGEYNKTPKRKTCGRPVAGHPGRCDKKGNQDRLPQNEKNEEGEEEGREGEDVTETDKEEKTKGSEIDKQKQEELL